VNYNPLLSSLIEIFDGYSRFDLNGQTLFFRHFSLRHQNLISNNYEKYKNIAISKGIETEEQTYDRLKAEENWTQDDDLKIAELESYISNLKKTKSKLFLPSQMDEHQKTIDEEQVKLNILLNKKSELISTTAESYANKMSNEEFLRVLIYKDEQLKELKYSDEEFGELTSSELSEISSKYFILSDRLNEDNIQKIVLQDFFNMYISCCEDAYIFFGKFIHELTAYQMKLLLFARIFNNIFQYNDDIPDSIKKDPKAIFNFVESKKTREKFQSQSSNSDGSMVFGATKKDIEILDPSAKKISLSDEIAKNGGSLSMEQMMDLIG
jgi:uncharacterized coiled-coil protein SlyX